LLGVTVRRATHADAVTRARDNFIIVVVIIMVAVVAAVVAGMPASYLARSLLIVFNNSSVAHESVHAGRVPFVTSRSSS